jgi:dsDNA-specific endonuclease/ATPase MutS2
LLHFELIQVRAWACHFSMDSYAKIESGKLCIDERFSFEALDYGRVRDELIRRMQSEISYHIAETLVPLTDVDEIQATLDETDEARRFIDRERAAPYFSQMDDLRPILLRASKGSILTIEDILATARTIRIIRLASGTIVNSEREYPLLKYLAGLLPRA